MNLLAVSHWKQRKPADCLVACTAMVLEYLQVPTPYDRLTRLLRTMPIGTLFRNLRYLEASLGLSVTVGYGNLQLLEAHLETGLPIIVSVNTELLSYWNNQATIHALVVIGMDEEQIYVNDPAAEAAPKAIPRAEFELAWFEEKELYAVIGLI
ncbi:MAG: cysteine peptidase family C39 domain-containing protein [Chloroflexi bacterium]|nr:cysteine peptidase family C39 domain-containing protein [Chloroflexota bacterium]